MQLIVHGGAGSESETPDRRQAVLQAAATEGSTAATPIDAVERAIRQLEASPLFNAGHGGAVQSDGVVRTDAGLMTEQGQSGAVCSLTGVQYPISVARLVLEETPHVLMNGAHAKSLATMDDIDTENTLLTSESRERYRESQVPSRFSDQLQCVTDRYTSRMEHSENDSGTVGAVATAGDRLAVGTSTGGRWFALAGRIGDVPQIGAGYYGSSAGGASATGNGEAIARTAVAREAVNHLETGADPAESAEVAIAALEEQTNGRGGVIVMDPTGDSGQAYNTGAMQTAVGSST